MPSVPSEETSQNTVLWTLRSAVWEITLQCCFHCAYCGSQAGTAREKELSLEECLRVADELASLGCERVSLIGGEVFLRQDWAQIVRRLASHGIRVSIITNGFIFTPDLIETLRGVNIESVAVSLDGPEDIHDRYRQKGSFQRALQAIRVLHQADIPVSVITTLHHENAAKLEDMFVLLSTQPIFAWQIQACSPMGNARESGMNWDVDFGQVIAFVRDHLAEAPWIMGIADNIGYFTPEEGVLRGRVHPPARFAGCRAGLSSIGIDSTGNVRGCESMYDECFNEGNLREKSLAQIWNDPDAFAYNRKYTPQLLTGACRTCADSSLCAGGCRSYNHFSHGKLYESMRCAKSHPSNHTEQSHIENSRNETVPAREVI